MNSCFLFMILTSSGQKTNYQQFKTLSCSEKKWVVMHPFVAKKAHQITIEVRKTVEEVKRDSVLVGTGNALQVDAFRHTYWMALLTQKIGWRRAKKLGKAHEKGNYKMYKKGQKEDGALPDKISGEMDLFNNGVGIELGRRKDIENMIDTVIEKVKSGKCKIIKMDKLGNYLACDGTIITNEVMEGKWENNKCLVNSNEID
ncbi:MAG: hypothetical protein J5I47_01105 [Vicingus serpentipes]|nr:hypothetical protein [Vicingus serpentipes]